MCQATKLSHSVNFLSVHVEHTTTTTQCSNLLVVFSFFSSFKFPEIPKPKCCSYETESCSDMWRVRSDRTDLHTVTVQILVFDITLIIKVKSSVILDVLPEP